MHKTPFPRYYFLPYLLIAPQLLVTIVFFIWPAVIAIKQAFSYGDAFGLKTKFIWFENFIHILSSGDYLHSLFVTVIFSTLTSLLALIMGLVMAMLVYNVVKGRKVYKTFFIWPYAVAPAIAAMLWRFMFDPSVGIIGRAFIQLGIDWNYLLHGPQAMFLVVTASAWQQFSYNFLFFLAGLSAIPNSLLEAAAIDGASAYRRFADIIFPLLSPVTFFLLVINILYTLFDTFGIIHILTQGGPYYATNILMYKVYNDGILGLDIGSSAAQSVLLMLIVVGLTVIQFRFIDKKVHYK